MPKIGYRFNPETLSYDKIETPLRVKIGRLFRKFFSSLSLAIVIFFVISAVIDSPEEKALKREKEEILAQYNLLSNEIGKLDAVLKNLEERDDNIYRVIFEAEPIDAAIRRVGTGGVNKYEKLKDLKDADLIIGVSKKLDELSKALYVQSKSYDEIEKLAKNKVDMIGSIPAIIPLSLKNPRNRVSSSFGYRMHPFYKTVKFHAGMDFAGAVGTPIHATGNGKVILVSTLKGYGKCVMIDHGFSYQTLYGHLDSYNVKVGQTVKRGDVIAYLGNTGGFSTGPHLHYEVRKNKVPMNPINYYFNDLNPDEYDNITHIANNTGQSMD
ncbi:M23 family metallopeptidase [Odoribacter lunatus]|uniref:M23 family metallopeptidase n=1 Tax=Odoribacter lunatus TaxID=2941335 RepID=UPI00203C8886|nr:M23 family metallopeptidase [Odoribacter lunatus]